jgi:2',3'-cyclic-nucleotide 2'-phosphodiesterase
MRILFVGDVVGSMGREMITEYLSKLKKKHQPDFTIVNGENAASGRGITEKIYKKFLQDGADMVTLGNHTWDNKEIFDFIDSSKKLVRPANFPEGTPGKGLVYGEVHGKTVAVINVQGRTFMPPLDDPFNIIDSLVDEAKKKTSVIFVDFHAEATSEKQAMGWFLDGRVSAVIGTHTHVQTADNRVLPNGTAFMCDVGMTGPYDEVLGMNRESVLKRFQTSLPVRFEVPKEGRKILSACLIDVDHKTGKAKKIERILINEDHPFIAEY